MLKHCFRCDEPLIEPESNARYVRGDDITEEETVTQLYALTLTDELRTIRDDVAQFWDMDLAAANRVLARGDEHYLTATEVVDDTEQTVFSYSVSDGDFDRVAVDDPVSPSEDPDVVRTIEVEEPQTVQKTGLVCRPDCVKDSDEIIW